MVFECGTMQPNRMTGICFEKIVVAAADHFGYISIMARILHPGHQITHKFTVLKDPASLLPWQRWCITEAYSFSIEYDTRYCVDYFVDYYASTAESNNTNTWVRAHSYSICQMHHAFDIWSMNGPLPMFFGRHVSHDWNTYLSHAYSHHLHHSHRPASHTYSIMLYV